MKLPDGPVPVAPPLKLLDSLGRLVVSAVCFHLAFGYARSFPAAGILVFGYLGGLWALRRQSSGRSAFWWGTAVGWACLAPQTAFLWTVFGVPLAGFHVAPLAPVLWLLVSLWHGVFLVLARLAEAQFGRPRGWLIVPALWLGLEYLRAEVWWLRFSWLVVGECLPGPAVWWRWFGVYGLGAMAWSLLICGHLLRDGDRRWRTAGGLGLGLLGLTLSVAAVRPKPGHEAAAGRSLNVAGVQWEFPSEPELLRALNRLLSRFPETDLIVLSEYTFDGPPPTSIRRWCREHNRWLLAGGKEPVSPGTTGRDSAAPFRNTAFVIDPQGEVVFTQAKVQPIQFFSDGLPAMSQRVWASPWGPLGIAICYDASYRRVMDELVRQGARGLLLPTMDIWEWGPYEHRLNARQASLRAREYAMPVLRLASSGESLLLDTCGQVTASAPFEEPGTGNVLAGRMTLAASATRPPLDEWLAPAALTLVVGWLAGTGALSFRRRHAG